MTYSWWDNQPFDFNAEYHSIDSPETVASAVFGLIPGEKQAPGRDLQTLLPAAPRRGSSNATLLSRGLENEGLRNRGSTKPVWLRFDAVLHEQYQGCEIAKGAWITVPPQGKMDTPLVGTTVKPLFTYSIGQKWLYLLQKILKSRYGFP
jgi:hypothetical protein